MSEEKSVPEKIAKRLSSQKATVIREGYIGTHDDRLERGFCYVTGRIETAGDIILPTVLQISVSDQGEHCGTLVPINGKLVHVHEGAFLEIMEGKGIEICPYSYNYDPVIERDIHIEGQPEIEKLTPKQRNRLERAVDYFERSGKTFILEEKHE